MSNDDNDKLKVKFKIECYLEKVNGCHLQFTTEAWYTPEKGIYKIGEIQLKDTQVEHTYYGRCKTYLEILDSLRNSIRRPITYYYNMFGEEKFMGDFKELFSLKKDPIYGYEMVVWNTDFILKLLDHLHAKRRNKVFWYKQGRYVIDYDKIKVLEVENVRREVECSKPFIRYKLLDIIDNANYITTGHSLDKEACEEVLLEALGDVQRLSLLNCMVLEDLDESCLKNYDVITTIYAINEGLKRLRMEIQDD